MTRRYSVEDKLITTHIGSSSSSSAKDLQYEGV